MDKIIKIIKEVPPIVWVLSALLAVLLVFKNMFSISKGLKDVWSYFTDQTEDEKESAGGYVDNLPYADSSNTSMSQSEIRQEALALYDAMNDGGTDSQAVFDILESVNRDELVMLIDAFGVKEGSNLVQWLKSELSDYTWYDWSGFFAETEYQRAKKIFEGHGLVW